MTRTPPMEDWIVYLLVGAIVVSMMYGKYLIARGDKDDKSKDNS